MSKEYVEILSKARTENVPVLHDESALFLVDLINNFKPKNILEIGTAVGYSGSLMLKHCNGKLTTIEKDEQRAAQAEKNFNENGFSKRVKIITGDAAEEINKLTEKYDFIFLDGPKAQYIKYLPHLLNLLESGGVLVADNVLFKGLVESEAEIPKKLRTIVKNLKLFIKEISSNKDVTTTIYKIGDGISVTIKNKETK